MADRVDNPGRSRRLATLGRASRRAARTSIFQMAAALSYRTIFSLIPMLVVGLVALKMFATDEDIRELLRRLMAFGGLSTIRLEAPVDDPAGWSWFSGPLGVPMAMHEASAPEPASAAELDEMIQSLVTRVSALPFRTIGLIGLGALIYAAISMLVEVERAFNAIYHAPRGRSWVKRVMQYWTLITLGTLGLFATFYVGERFKLWLVEAAGRDALPGQVVSLGALGFASTVTISTGLLLIAYLTVPNTRVRARPALAGAIVAALLWESGKWGFTQYLHNTANYARLYGSLALIPLFMLWVYVTWIIVLVGLNVAHSLQSARGRRARESLALGEPVIVDPAAIFAIARELADRLATGVPATAQELADRARVPASIAARMADALAEGGVVLRVAPDAAAPHAARYALARTPDRIDAHALLTIAEAMEGAAGQAVPSELGQARRSALEGRTLAWVMTPREEPTRAPGLPPRVPAPEPKPA